jgi:hypothetical protein
VVGVSRATDRAHAPLSPADGDGWRQRAASSECNRDPIFLYQVKARDDDSDPGWRVEPWRTESVWLSRGECEAWGRRNEHNYPEGLWRCYCLCAEGELARLLTEHAGPGR